MPFHVCAQVLVVNLHLEIAFENGEINDKWMALALDNILCEDLVGAWVIEPAIVVSRGQDVCSYLIVCQLACIKIDDEVFFKRFQFDIIIDLFNECSIANGNLSVN